MKKQTPNDGRFILSSSQMHEKGVELQIMNVLGEIVHREYIPRLSLSEIDAGTLPNGIYFLVLKGNETMPVIKFVISR
jgi:hypothetical protein